MLSLIRRNSISQRLACSSSENFTKCSIQDDIWQRKKFHRLEKRKQCSAIAAGAGDHHHHHHSMLLKEVVGTLTFGEKKREAAAQYSSRTDDPPTTSAGPQGVRWNHDDKERKAAPRGQSLFKLLIFSSLLSSSPSYVAWGRAGGNSTRLWNQQPPSPPNACQRWMDGRIGRMNRWGNEWMDGWTGSYTFSHLIAIPLRQPCWLLVVALVRDFYCPMDEMDRWMGGWMHECMDGRRVDGQELTLFSIRFQFP